MLTNVGVRTERVISQHERYPHNVTLSYSSRDNEVRVSGTIQHGSVVIVDQELVDQLQMLVDKQTYNGGL